MARVSPNQRLVASVLEPFLESDPQSSGQPGFARSQSLREIKESVRRDLENLLNTRQSCLRWHKDQKELEHSLLTYGMPDFANINLAGGEERNHFCRQLQTIIKRNEPRFRSVTVTPVPNTQRGDRTFRFRIDAVLLVEPIPEPVAFDSELRPATGDFHVEGAAG